MNRLISILSVCILATTFAYADPVTVPNAFTAGTPAKASEVNANFATLANAINSVPLQAGVYDSAGKRIGNLDMSYYGASVTLTSMPTYALINPIHFYIQPTGVVFTNTSSVYYTSSDCTGGEYLIVAPKGWPSTPVFTSTTSALVPYTDTPVTVTLNSSKDLIYDGHDIVASPCRSRNFPYTGAFTPFTSPNMMLLSQAQVVDLSVFSPPFSVH